MANQLCPVSLLLFAQVQLQQSGILSPFSTTRSRALTPCQPTTGHRLLDPPSGPLLQLVPGRRVLYLGGHSPPFPISTSFDGTSPGSGRSIWHDPDWRRTSHCYGHPARGCVHRRSSRRPMRAISAAMGCLQTPTVLSLIHNGELSIADQRKRGPINRMTKSFRIPYDSDCPS